MKQCTKCDAMNSGEIMNCENCGEMLINQPVAVPVAVKRKSPVKIIKIIICIVGILMGVYLLLNTFMNGSVFFNLGFYGFDGSSPNNAEFGGDFYTEVYKAVKYSAENTEELVELGVEACRIFAIMVGAFFVLFWSYMLCHVLEKKD